MDLSCLCMGCMELKEDSVKCVRCGWVEGTLPESSLYLPPRTVLHGKYLLGRVLGQGGFGVTYLAWHINLDLKLAIKEYFPSGLVYRETGCSIVSTHSGTSMDHYNFGLNKFLEEGKTLVKFEGHPNIVSVKDCFKANKTAYLVMNYLEGVTLKERLESRSCKLSFEEALQIITPVMDALQAVHSAGMLHRDISPENIFITIDERVIILDFGSTRHALRDVENDFIVIKPGYAPEEQYQSEGFQGPWTDIYAVAVTFYHAITNRMPPDARNRLDQDTIIPPSQLGAVLGLEEEKVLLKALSVRAEDRYQTIAQFQQALKKAQQSPPDIQAGNGNLSPQPSLIDESSSAIIHNKKSKPPLGSNFFEFISSRHKAVIVTAAVLFCVLILSLSAVMLWDAGVLSTPGGHASVINETIEYNGGKYIGETKNGVPHGYGTIVYTTSETSGFSAIFVSRQRKYVGQWEHGKKHGQGTMTNPDGSIRKGTWENNYYVSP